MKKTIVVALLIGLLLFSQVGSALEFTVPHLFDPVFMPGPGGPFDDAKAQAGDEAILRDVMGFLETQGIQGYETLASAGDGNLLGMALRKEKRTLLVMVRAIQASGFEIAFQSDALLRGDEAVPELYFPAGQESPVRFQVAYAKPEPGIEKEALVMLVPEGKGNWAVGSYSIQPAEGGIRRFEPQANGDWKLTEWQDGRPKSATFLRGWKLSPELAGFRFQDFPKTQDDAAKLSTWWYAVMHPSHGAQPVKFQKGKTWPVYSGPGEEYLMTASLNAKVSTNRIMDATGWENGWVFIRYQDQNSGISRAGYIHADALPKGVQVELYDPVMIKGEVIHELLLTDDPGVSPKSGIGNIPPGIVGYFLKVINDQYAHMEFGSEKAGKFRGFMPINNVFLPGEDVREFKHKAGIMTIYLVAQTTGTRILTHFNQTNPGGGKPPEAIQVMMDGLLLGTINKEKDGAGFEQLRISAYMGVLSFVPVRDGVADDETKYEMAIPGALLVDFMKDYKLFKGAPFR